MYTKDISILLYIYLHSDRLGSGSAVTDGRGEAVHVLGYMPYGETLLDLSQGNGYETPYQFTGYEKDQETGLLYAEARYYESHLSTFNSTDPMWHKYPHLSPYAYCADNPVMLVDPDGRKIRFAKGASPEFKAAFKEAIQHLNKNNVGGIASYLEKSNITYYIAETKEYYAAFRPLEQTIYWNPSLGLETKEGCIIYPTTVLNHELGHALILDLSYQKGKMKEYYAEQEEKSDPDYDTKNEKYVITRIEQKAAKALGEIKEGEVTRKNHRGTFIRTESPISNKPQNVSEPTILPEIIIEADR